jgi:hypothetical protein
MRGESVESHARALAWPGLARAGRRARAHDMRVNGPPKSGPSPCGGAATFCRERANNVFGKRLHATARDLMTSSTLLISLLRHRRPCWFRRAPFISKSNQYSISDLAFYFSFSDLVVIYIRNLIWNLSNYSTTHMINHGTETNVTILLYNRRFCTK